MVYLSNVDLIINKILIYKGTSFFKIFARYNSFPILTELDLFFEQVLDLVSRIEESSLGLEVYIFSYHLVGAETLLRFFRLPFFLTI